MQKTLTMKSIDKVHKSIMQLIKLRDNPSGTLGDVKEEFHSIMLDFGSAHSISWKEFSEQLKFGCSCNNELADGTTPEVVTMPPVVEEPMFRVPTTFTMKPIPPLSSDCDLSDRVFRPCGNHIGDGKRSKKCITSIADAALLKSARQRNRDMFGKVYEYQVMKRSPEPRKGQERFDNCINTITFITMDGYSVTLPENDIDIEKTSMTMTERDKAVQSLLKLNAKKRNEPAMYHFKNEWISHDGVLRSRIDSYDISDCDKDNDIQTREFGYMAI